MSMYHNDEPDLPETDDKHVGRQRITYTEPPAERVAHLRAMYDANVAAGRAPYAGVHIHSRDEVLWILRERGWSVEYDSFYVKYVLNPRGTHVERANLAHANLASVDLSGTVLRRADLSHANLTQANLVGADLVDASLADADMGFAKLNGAHLGWTNLSSAHLRGADLRDARLMFADLTGTRLFRSDLRGADLYASHMNVSTVLGKVRLDANTRLGDIIWNGAPLTQIEWEQLTRLGDEAELSRSKADDGTAKTAAQRRDDYEAAARAYNQLALALQSQGLNDAAAPFAYRARALERRLALRQRRLGRWLFLSLLALLAGYGYRMGRILIAYAAVVLLAALAYYALGVAYGPHLSPATSLLVSITAFHGRVFSNQFSAETPQAWVTAVEAIAGLVIESVFIAMLAQRFFGK